jgi:hypothetical protein
VVKRDHEVGANAPDVPHKLLSEQGLVGLFEFAIVVVKEIDLVDAQNLRRFFELAFTDLP